MQESRSAHRRGSHRFTHPGSGYEEIENQPLGQGEAKQKVVAPYARNSNQNES